MEQLAAYFIVLVVVLAFIGAHVGAYYLRKHNPPMPFWGPLFRWIGRKLRP